jgi:hypothetical protein
MWGLLDIFAYFKPGRLLGPDWALFDAFSPFFRNKFSAVWERDWTAAAQ